MFYYLDKYSLKIYWYLGYILSEHEERRPRAGHGGPQGGVRGQTTEGKHSKHEDRYSKHCKHEDRYSKHCKHEDTYSKHCKHEGI